MSIRPCNNCHFRRTCCIPANVMLGIRNARKHSDMPVLSSIKIRCAAYATFAEPGQRVEVLKYGHWLKGYFMCVSSRNGKALVWMDDDAISIMSELFKDDMGYPIERTSDHNIVGAYPINIRLIEGEKQDTCSWCNRPAFTNCHCANNYDWPGL